MNKIYNFGILGCGMIANIHADAISGIENARLIGVADVRTENAEIFAKKLGTKAYKDYDEMILDENVDVVCICTPNGTHADCAIKALEKNKHVVLEKPIAISVESANEIIKASEKTGAMLTVISQLRFSENITRVKELLNKKALGEILSCDLYMKYWRDSSYYSGGSWKGTMKMDGGGALMNQGIHGVDILQYLAGVPKVLSSKTKTLFHNIEAEDMAAAIVEYENGALGVIQASTCTHPGFERRIEIVGTNGYVILRESEIEKLVIGGKEEFISEKKKECAGSAGDPAAITSDLHKKQIVNLINAISGEEDLLIDVREGAKAVEIICDIYNKSING